MSRGRRAEQRGNEVDSTRWPGNRSSLLNCSVRDRGIGGAIGTLE